MTVYPDTSFIVCCYLPQQFSREADTRMARGSQALVTPLQQVETAHAIFLQAFRGVIRADQAESAYSDFEQDCNLRRWKTTPLPTTSFALCTQIARLHASTIGTRTLDALHVAVALELKVDSFWTFDNRQARLAEAMGLNIYP